MSETQVAPKKKHRSFKILLIILVIPVIAVLVLRLVNSLSPSVQRSYWTKQDTGGEIEKTYAALGTYGTSEETLSVKEDSGTKRKYYAVYPNDASQKYPLVLMVNGLASPITNTRTFSAAWPAGATPSSGTTMGIPGTGNRPAPC